MTTNDDVVFNGKLLGFKFIQEPTKNSGIANALYLYKDDYFIITISMENINNQSSIYAHWGDDAAEKIM
jgi:hypothetical protein